MATFDEIVSTALGPGVRPYDYQQLIAHEGFPELVSVPTGAGKTMAAVLPWLYRRRFHPDHGVRESTHRRLVFVLPMRVLVEQTAAVVQRWLDNLGLADDVLCEVLMGGEPRRSAWRIQPASDAVIIGTLDMVLSRALNRGFGESRYIWPIDFGLLNADCQYVFDEIQLMGPALATSRQLHGLRSALGTADKCASTWMSATVPEAQLRTIDAPEVASRVELSDADRTSDGLGRRLAGTKSIVEIEIQDSSKPERSLAAAIMDAHRAGTLTIAVMNTVERARALHAEMARLQPAADLVLLHSRFRPPERAEHVEAALAPVDPSGPGTIVVSTQVIEAGVDLDAATLFTEAAPWPSIVQRAGRCNRTGTIAHALLLWAEPPKPLPYLADDVAGSVDQLRQLEGRSLGPEDFGACNVEVAEVISPVLRRRDLLQLFDTQPDLSGNDIDISRFIRDVDELTVSVAWRPIGAGAPGPDVPLPGRAERCPAPISDLRDLLKGGRDAWRWSHLDRCWQRCRPSDLRPGDALLVDVTFGCYSTATGWDKRAKGSPVDPVVADDAGTDIEADRASDDDPESFQRSWLELAQHLADVETESANMFAELSPEGIAPELAEAAVVAARLHDIGKAHPAFQAMLRSAADNDGSAAAPPADGVLLAKSAGRGRGGYSHDRRHFRHELASALALLGDWSSLIDALPEPDVVTYLVAAHHGRVRMAMRSLPDEGSGQILGIYDGDELPPVLLPGGPFLPPATLSLRTAQLGSSDDGAQSWTARSTLLRDRADIGPFRLGFLEAIVRLADWRASRSPGASVADLANASDRPERGSR